jgi:phosphoenolpyruvate phosphomutase
MCDATTVPFLLDGDTGYGNFNNMRRLVKKLEQNGLAGVCIEDKLFPKTNSFLRSEKQPLADIEEFSGKIKAGKDSQTDSDFCIVARVEAFIAGWGLDAALERAHAYHEAGADAVLVHSKLAKPDEILAFMKQWKNTCPVVIVPTKYYATPTQVFRDHGISLVIWANHLMRTSITAMKQTAAKVFSSQSLIEVEDAVATLSEVFRLQNDEELQRAEKRYLRGGEDEDINAVILAATRGEELESITQDIPKALIPVNGKPIAQRTVELMREQSVKDITIVRGYHKEKFTLAGVNYSDNDRYETSGELSSLYCAKDAISGQCLISYGDILFRKYILAALINEDADITVVVDGTMNQSSEGTHDFVQCSQPYTRSFDESKVSLIKMTSVHDGSSVNGEWIGLMKCSKKGSALLSNKLEELSKQSNFTSMNIDSLLNGLIADGVEVRVLYIEGNWLDVDTLQDYTRSSAY